MGLAVSSRKVRDSTVLCQRRIPEPLRELWGAAWHRSCHKQSFEPIHLEGTWEGNIKGKTQTSGGQRGGGGCQCRHCPTEATRHGGGSWGVCMRTGVPALLFGTQALLGRSQMCELQVSSLEWLPGWKAGRWVKPALHLRLGAACSFAATAEYGCPPSPPS